MGSPLDLALAVILVLLALAFAIWRMALTKKPPACAPEGEARPQVLLGKNLARGLGKPKGPPRDR